MTPTRTAFRELFILSKTIIDTYDYLPDASAKYPFCFIEKGRNDEAENSDLYGMVTITVHWFGKRSDGKVIDNAISKFHDSLLRFNSNFGYAFQLKKWREIPQYPSPDEPQVEHYLAEIDLIYNRKD